MYQTLGGQDEQMNGYLIHCLAMSNGAIGNFRRCEDRKEWPLPAGFSITYFLAKLYYPNGKDNVSNSCQNISMPFIVYTWTRFFLDIPQAKYCMRCLGKLALQWLISAFFLSSEEDDAQLLFLFKYLRIILLVAGAHLSSHFVQFY